MKMINREEAQKLIEKHLSSKMQMHCREVEVIMRKTAIELHENPEKWGITGLLHDLDFESLNNDFAKHGVKIREMLSESDLDPDSWHTIASHCEDFNGIKRKNNFDYALAASDNVSGLIYATTLIYPDKKITSVKVKSITKRMKTPAFAKNVNRQAIFDIEKTGISLERFIALALEAMTEIAVEIGL